MRRSERGWMPQRRAAIAIESHSWKTVGQIYSTPV
jgi:hypothetical protein